MIYQQQKIQFEKRRPEHVWLSVFGSFLSSRNLLRVLRDFDNESFYEFDFDV